MTSPNGRHAPGLTTCLPPSRSIHFCFHSVLTITTPQPLLPPFPGCRFPVGPCKISSSPLPAGSVLVAHAAAPEAAWSCPSTTRPHPVRQARAGWGRSPSPESWSKVDLGGKESSCSWRIVRGQGRHEVEWQVASRMGAVSVMFT